MDILIGKIEDYDVTYNSESDTIACKDLIVFAQALIDAYESPMDRVMVDKGLILRKYQLTYTLGCFEMPINQCNQLIKTIKNARNQKKS